MRSENESSPSVQAPTEAASNTEAMLVEARRQDLNDAYNRAKILSDGSRILVEPVTNASEVYGYRTRRWAAPSAPDANGVVTETRVPSVTFSLQPPTDWDEVIKEMKAFKGTATCCLLSAAAGVGAIVAYEQQSIELLIAMLLVALLTAIAGAIVHSKESAAWDKQINSQTEAPTKAGPQNWQTSSKSEVELTSVVNTLPENTENTDDPEEPVQHTASPS